MDMVQVDTPKTTTNTLSMFIATPVRSCGRENFSNVFLTQTAHLLAEWAFNFKYNCFISINLITKIGGDIIDILTFKLFFCQFCDVENVENVENVKKYNKF